MRFVVETVFRAIDLYSFVLVIYSLMSWFPGAYQTSLGRLILWLVEPVIKPFRKYNLQFYGLDFTVLLVFFACQLLRRLLVFLLFLLY